MAAKKNGPPISFRRGGKQPRSETEKILLPYFRNSLPTVRQVLPTLKLRMTDEQILQHVQILQRDKWPEIGINYTLTARPFPLPHASELVVMKQQLVELGLSEREAILFLVPKGKDAPIESLEALQRKIRITFDNHRLRETPISKYSMTCLAVLLKAPDERLETIRRRMEEEDIDTERWITMLFRYVRAQTKEKKKSA